MKALNKKTNARWSRQVAMVIWLGIVGFSGRGAGQPLWRMDAPLAMFTTDRLGQLYTVAAGEALLRKYSAAGIELRTYALPVQYGALASIKAENPYRIALFFKDFQQLVVLDQDLNEVSAIGLASDWGIGWATALATANDGGIWLFDAAAAHLLKKDAHGRGAAAMVVTDGFSPQEVVQDGNYVALLDSTWGAGGAVRVLDQYGTLVFEWATDGAKAIQLTEGELLYLDADGVARAVSLRFFSPRTVALPPRIGSGAMRHFRVENTQIFIQRADGRLEVFAYK